MRILGQIKNQIQELKCFPRVAPFQQLHQSETDHLSMVPNPWRIHSSDASQPLTLILDLVLFYATA